jgi:hypothetical protein
VYATQFESLEKSLQKVAAKKGIGGQVEHFLLIGSRESN